MSWLRWIHCSGVPGWAMLDMTWMVLRDSGLFSQYMLGGPYVRTVS